MKAGYQLGILDRVALLLLVVYLILLLAGVPVAFSGLVFILLIVIGAAALFRLARLALRKTIWQLRNRLYVAYLFIAVVPITLIVVLGLIASYMLVGQIAVFLASSELERRTDGLYQLTRFLVRAGNQARDDWFARPPMFLEERFPGLRIMVRGTKQWTYPPGAPMTAPPAGWGDDHGIVVESGLAWVWAHAREGQEEVVALVPLTRAFLASLAPGLGDIDLIRYPSNGQSRSPNQSPDLEPPSLVHRDNQPRRSLLPEAVSRFDAEVPWAVAIPAAVWSIPGRHENELLSIRSRPSAVVRVLFQQRVSTERDIFGVVLFTVAGLFLIAEVISLIIGVSITRAITDAVHNLYEGTERVMQGDFSHRIDVKGQDQLASLGQSFNRMTENLERLVKVEKERERLHAELAIASEVQNQLFPGPAPNLANLCIRAFCHPARMVSGDYYDYQLIGDGKLALAIGDVAGKGISAALLMATVQATLRAQLRFSLEAAAAVGGSSANVSISPAALVSRLNQQLHASTSLEKYSTFFFALYDDRAGSMTYTNAGHLPPMLFREGSTIELDVNGMVIGAFPFAEYEESRAELLPGDLLLCYTDGITEPENEFGEMFGPERLITVVQRNMHRTDEEIVECVITAVHEWTGSPELQDDMTLLLARRV